MKIAIIGAGKWGNALFHALSQRNDCVISSRRQLEGVHFVGLKEALKRDLLVVAIPSQSVSGWLKEHFKNYGQKILVASKGIETSSLRFLDEIYEQHVSAANLAFLSGPSFAKEIQNDLGKPIPTSGDLTRWAKQGVLLLNATLTVRAHIANSHQTLGWANFTDAAIEALSAHREHIVFMLWGGFARSKKRLIDANRHCIIESVHPSPLSANRGGWFGQHQFSRCNAYLKQQGLDEIDW